MRRLLAVGVFGAISALGGIAEAGDADTFYQRGRALMQAKRYAEACPALAESVKLEPGIGAMLWLGECYEKNNQLGDAYRQFRAAAKVALVKKDDRAKVAQRRASTIEPKLTRLAIIVNGADDAIELDGAVVTAEDLGAPQPVAPGVHTIVASATGKAPWTVSVTVPNQPDVVTVNVPALEDVAAPPAVAAEAPPVVRVPVIVAEPVALPPAPKEKPKSATPWRMASLGFGALGVAALGGGAVLGLEAKSKYDSSDDHGHCVNNACDSTGKAARQDATSLASKSTAAFIVGFGALGAGVVLFALTPTTTVTPALGGASLTHRF